MVEDFLDRLKKAPSILSLLQMREFISELKDFSYELILVDAARFCEILEILAESYNAGTYFEVTAEEKPFFVDFSKWICNFSNDINFSEPCKNSVESIAGAFLIFPDEVYGG